MAVKRAVTALAAVLLVGVIAPVISVNPASAHAPCGTSPSDKDGSTWRATANGANMRSGSSTSCTITGIAYAGQRLDYHCYTGGNDGYTWTFVPQRQRQPQHLRLDPRRPAQRLRQQRPMLTWTPRHAVPRVSAQPPHGSTRIS